MSESVTAYLPFLAVVSILALCIAVVTLILHFARGQEHPDVARVRSEVIALDQALTDLNDRVAQWMRRESVRRMREAKEQKLVDKANGSIPDRGTPEYKLYLRRLGLHRGAQNEVVEK